MSFAYQFHDYENAFPTTNPHTGDEEWDYPITRRNYPRALEGHREFERRYDLPDVVRRIYDQTVTALQEEASILGGLGLRATIEAICNHLSIAGKDLSTRINALAKKGFISTNDSQLLHAIRFMGNDAAHEIKEPTPKSLRTALSIVDHLLESIFILPESAQKNLETGIVDYPTFVDLLRRKLGSFSTGDQYPLAKFLGKDVRRLTGSRADLENQLILEIRQGKMKELSLGQVDHYAGSKEKLQHFVKA